MSSSNPSFAEQTTKTTVTPSTTTTTSNYTAATTNTPNTIGSTPAAATLGSSTHPSTLSSTTATPSTTSTTTTTSSSTGASTAATIKDKAAHALHSAADALTAAGQKISASAHSVDDRYHISSKASDMASHLGASLKRGNVSHAVTNAGTAATIGDAERRKHESGPLPEHAHAADATTASTTTTSTTNTGMTDHAKDESATSSSHYDKLEDPSKHSMRNQINDATSHIGAALSHGNVVHAAKFASTAATIGECEREKHAKGPLDTTGVDMRPEAHVDYAKPIDATSRQTAANTTVDASAPRF